jgi:glycosyltransferase involved in cell wall biosynthesis
MKTSFISTVFNEEKNIEKFLNSIIAQTKKPDEAIIVDGGSKDKTYKILKNYSEKYKWIKIFQEKGANIARGRNIAISKAKGEVILISDAGCIIDNDWIENTLKYFPEADVVAGSYKGIIKNNFTYFQALLTIKKVNRPARMSSRNVAFKKKCWEAVGGYPEKSLTGEDNRLMINMIKKGFKIKINPKPLVSWDMRPTLKKFAKQYYLYGKGDRMQGNLLKKTLRKNLLMVFGFWIYLAVFFVISFINSLISLTLIILPILLLFLYSLIFLIRTRKISTLYWIPLLIMTKRISYILGVSFK